MNRECEAYVNERLFLMGTVMEGEGTLISEYEP